MAISSRGGWSRKTSSQSVLRTTSSSLAGATPAANVPPTIDPMLVPVTAVDGHPQFLQHLEHADVRDAACPTARKRESDARRGGRHRARPWSHRRQFRGERPRDRRAGSPPARTGVDRFDSSY
jgi:hypothetical protein